MLPIDFGNCDADGAVRLVTRATVDALKEQSVELKEGMTLTLTDGELTAEGVTKMRDGLWVVIINRWL